MVPPDPRLMVSTSVRTGSLSGFGRCGDLEGMSGLGSESVAVAVAAAAAQVSWFSRRGASPTFGASFS